jgi:preprotein translocase subunit SecD
MPAASEPVPTIRQDSPPLVPALNDAAQHREDAAAPSQKKNVFLWIVFAVLLLMFVAGVVVGGLAMYKRRALTWHLTLAVDPSTPDRDAAAKQAATVIEKRLDALGMPNFRVSTQDGGRITVDLPSVKDPERVKLLISAAGKLELVHVISPGSPAPVQTYATRDEAIASLNANGSTPTNRRVLPYQDRDNDSSSADKWVVIEAPPIVNGGDLTTAAAAPSRQNGVNYHVNFTLNKAGADKFGAWTGANINEYLGVVLNDEVKSIAYIKSAIYDQGQIDGHFTEQAAEDLALVLKSGALPAKIFFQEERIDK